MSVIRGVEAGTKLATADCRGRNSTQQSSEATMAADSLKTLRCCHRHHGHAAPAAQNPADEDRRDEAARRLIA
jgi:hypothetical protein